METRESSSDVPEIVRPRTSKMAIASLVCALLVIPSLIVTAVIGAFVARAEAVKHVERERARAEREAMAARARFEREKRARERAAQGLPAEAEPEPAPTPEQEEPRGKPIATTIVAISVPAIALIIEVCAFVFGFVSLSRIKRSAGALSGRGLSIAGIVIASANIVLPVCLAVPAIFLAASRPAAPQPFVDEADPQGNVRPK
jgi:hypothetical protein